MLNYYHQIKSDIVLQHYYPILKGVYNDTPFFKRIWIGIEGYVPFLFNLKKRLGTEQFDILHFISSGSIALIRDLLTVKIAKKYKVKTIVHFRFGRIPEIYEKKGWEYRLIDKVISSVDRAIVIDENSYNTLRKEGYVNVLLLPNPLAPEIHEIIKQNKTITKQDNKIVFVGHVVVTKGVYELIEACKQIKNIKLKLVGYVTESAKAELLTLVGENSADWIEIIGEQDYETTIKEMLSAGVFVLPTYTEGFPNVILESMACGCPIVTTNVGAIPEMLDISKGFNYGIVVEPRDIKQLKEAINKMLEDREYAVQCGVNAQQRVNEMYSMSSVWNNLELMWKEI